MEHGYGNRPRREILLRRQLSVLGAEVEHDVRLLRGLCRLEKRMRALEIGVGYAQVRIGSERVPDKAVQNGRVIDAPPLRGGPARDDCGVLRGYKLTLRRRRVDDCLFGQKIVGTDVAGGNDETQRNHTNAAVQNGQKVSPSALCEGVTITVVVRPAMSRVSAGTRSMWMRTGMRWASRTHWKVGLTFASGDSVGWRSRSTT